MHVKAHALFAGRCMAANAVPRNRLGPQWLVVVPSLELVMQSGIRSSTDQSPCKWHNCNMV